MTPLLASETHGAAFIIKIAGKSVWLAIHCALSIADEESAAVGQSELSEIGSGSEKSLAIESVTVGAEWSETEICSEAGQVDIVANFCNCCEVGMTWDNQFGDGD